MKKYTQLMMHFLLLSIICVFLSACSKLAVTNRHYRSGYCISRTAERVQPQELRKNKISFENLKQYKNKTIQTEKQNEQQVIISAEEIQKIEKAPVKAQKHKIFEQPKKVAALITRIKKAKSDNTFSASTKSMKQDPRGDVLSLLWIVILVLLIFWAIAFIAGGFGLGGLIHLLLAIALILLILWLLRII